MVSRHLFASVPQDRCGGGFWSGTVPERGFRGFPGVSGARMALFGAEAGHPGLGWRFFGWRKGIRGSDGVFFVGNGVSEARMERFRLGMECLRLGWRFSG